MRYFLPQQLHGRFLQQQNLLPKPGLYSLSDLYGNEGASYGVSGVLIDLPHADARAEAEQETQPSRHVRKERRKKHVKRGDRSSNQTT